MSLTKVTYSMIKSAPANVLDFGAVADGSGITGTDNTAAFQAALDSGAQIVKVPYGSYLIDTLNIPSGVTLDMTDNPTLLFKAHTTSHNPMLRIGNATTASTQAKVKGGKLIGNKANQTYSGEEWSPGILIWGSNSNIVEDVEITDVAGDGITIGYDVARVVSSNNNVISYCDIYGQLSSRQAIAITYGSNNRILYNRCSGNIDLEISFINDEIKNNLVHGNVGRSSAGAVGTPKTSDLSIGVGTLVAGATNNNNGNIISENHCFAINNQITTNTQIVNNYIVGSYSSQAYLMDLAGADNQLIANNVFDANLSVASGLQQVIRTRGCQDIIVSNNIVNNGSIPFHLPVAGYGSSVTATYQNFNNNVLTGTGLYRASASINPSEYGRFLISNTNGGSLTSTQIGGVPTTWAGVSRDGTRLAVYSVGGAGFVNSGWRMAVQSACNNTTASTSVTNAIAMPNITYSGGYAYVDMNTVTSAAGALSASAFSFASSGNTGSFIIDVWY